MSVLFSFESNYNGSLVRTNGRRAASDAARRMTFVLNAMPGGFKVFLPPSVINFLQQSLNPVLLFLWLYTWFVRILSPQNVIVTLTNVYRGAASLWMVY